MQADTHIDLLSKDLQRTAGKSPSASSMASYDHCGDVIDTQNKQYKAAQHRASSNCLTSHVVYHPNYQYYMYDPYVAVPIPSLAPYMQQPDTSMLTAGYSSIAMTSEELSLPYQTQQQTGEHPQRSDVQFQHQKTQHHNQQHAQHLPQAQQNTDEHKQQHESQQTNQVHHSQQQHNTQQHHMTQQPNTHHPQQMYAEQQLDAPQQTHPHPKTTSQQQTHQQQQTYTQQAYLQQQSHIHQSQTQEQTHQQQTYQAQLNYQQQLNIQQQTAMYQHPQLQIPQQFTHNSQYPYIEQQPYPQHPYHVHYTRQHQQQYIYRQSLQHQNASDDQHAQQQNYVDEQQKTNLPRYLQQLNSPQSPEVGITRNQPPNTLPMFIESDSMTQKRQPRHQQETRTDHDVRMSTETPNNIQKKQQPVPEQKQRAWQEQIERKQLDEQQTKGNKQLTEKKIREKMHEERDDTVQQVQKNNEKQKSKQKQKVGLEKELENGRKNKKVNKKNTNQKQEEDQQQQQQGKQEQEKLNIQDNLKELPHGQEEHDRDENKCYKNTENIQQNMSKSISVSDENPTHTLNKDDIKKPPGTTAENDSQSNKPEEPGVPQRHIRKFPHKFKLKQQSKEEPTQQYNLRSCKKNHQQEKTKKRRDEAMKTSEETFSDQQDNTDNLCQDPGEQLAVSDSTSLSPNKTSDEIQQGFNVFAIPSTASRNMYNMPIMLNTIIPDVHTCRVCDMAFLNADARNMHELIHFGIATNVPPMKKPKLFKKQIRHEKSSGPKKKRRASRKTISPPARLLNTSPAMAGTIVCPLFSEKDVHADSDSDVIWCEEDEHVTSKNSETWVAKNEKSCNRPTARGPKEYGKWRCLLKDYSQSKEPDQAFNPGTNDGEPTVNQCESKEEFPCNLCGKTFKFKQNRKVHMNSIHYRKTSFKCATCSRVFLDPSNFSRHQKTHFSDGPGTHTMSGVANRSLTITDSQRKTMSYFHYACPICGIQFVLCDSLHAHIARNHTAEFPFMDVPLKTRTIDWTSLDLQNSQYQLAGHWPKSSISVAPHCCSGSSLPRYQSSASSYCNTSWSASHAIPTVLPINRNMRGCNLREDLSAVNMCVPTNIRIAEPMNMINNYYENSRFPNNLMQSGNQNSRNNFVSQWGVQYDQDGFNMFNNSDESDKINHPATIVSVRPVCSGESPYFTNTSTESAHFDDSMELQSFPPNIAHVPRPILVLDEEDSVVLKKLKKHRDETGSRDSRSDRLDSSFEGCLEDSSFCTYDGQVMPPECDMICSVDQSTGEPSFHTRTDMSLAAEASAEQKLHHRSYNAYRKLAELAVDANLTDRYYASDPTEKKHWVDQTDLLSNPRLDAYERLVPNTTPDANLPEIGTFTQMEDTNVAMFFTELGEKLKEIAGELQEESCHEQFAPSDVISESRSPLLAETTQEKPDQPHTWQVGNEFDPENENVISDEIIIETLCQQADAEKKGYSSDDNLNTLNTINEVFKSPPCATRQATVDDDSVVTWSRNADDAEQSSDAQSTDTLLMCGLCHQSFHVDHFDQHMQTFHPPEDSPGNTSRMSKTKRKHTELEKLNVLRISPVPSKSDNP